MRVSPRPARRFDHSPVVLGIDPGTASTGFGVVERRGGTLVSHGGGVISTSADDPPASDHAADALALAICHATQMPLDTRPSAAKASDGLSESPARISNT